MSEISETHICRSCNSSELLSVLNLGEIYASAFVEKSDEPQLKAPLELLLCQNCTLLQLRHSVDPEFLYRNYFYKSFINMGMRAHLQNLADDATYRSELRNGDIVLDIGCNDGSLLRSFPMWAVKVGFEPAKNFIPEAKVGTDEIYNEFFNAETWIKHMSTTKARVITSIAMFYDLEDPTKFVQDIKKCLDRDGLWILEMHYLPSLIKRNSFDAICHEHLELYSLRSLKHLLDRHNLDIIDVDLNEINGGSFRVYIKHGSALPHKYRVEQQSKNTLDLLRLEERYGFATPLAYEDFAERVKKICYEVWNFIAREVSKGTKIYGYGASTKGNTFLQFAKIDKTFIHAIAERSKDKIGKKTVGTEIPICSEEEWRTANPPYTLLLIWQFLPTILEREKDYLQRGGKFIVALPEPKVVDKDGERPL